MKSSIQFYLIFSKKLQDIVRESQMTSTSKNWKRDKLSMTIDLSFNHLWCTFLIFFENVHLPGIVLKDVKFTDFVEKNSFLS